MYGREKDGFRRRRDLAAIHAAKKQLRLDDDAYRDILFAATGKRSAGALDARERMAAIERFRQLGFKPISRGTPTVPRRHDFVPHDRAEHRLVAALWRNLWLLGEVEDPGPRALDRFVERQAKVAALRFLAPEQLRAVVQALKGWLERVGFQTPSHKASDVKRLALQRLVKAQWARLEAMGELAFKNANHRDFALDRHFDRHFAACAKGVGHAMTTAAELTALAESLGKWIRSAIARRKAEDAPGAKAAPQPPANSPAESSFSENR